MNNSVEYTADAEQLKCPVCLFSRNTLVYHFDEQLDQPLLAFIQRQRPDWDTRKGICLFCLNKFYRAFKANSGRGNYEFLANLLPIPALLNANPKFNGKGVTICFIDSGIYAHPDLTQPYSRLKYVKDFTKDWKNNDWIMEIRPSSWHGTMTTVVCSGNGYLSSGHFKGLAGESEVVVLKVMDDVTGEISEDHIAAALQWVLENHADYQIRILNLSVTTDFPDSYRDSPVDLLIQKIYQQGVVIVAAVGNNPEAEIKPPANAPEVLAVGGLDAHNTLDPLQQRLYHSTYGWTVDGLLKPDLIAPAVSIPAPILPATPQKLEAEALFHIIDASPAAIKTILREVIHHTRLPATLANENEEKILAAAKQLAEEQLLISADYELADGTSFAAPILCSIIAQMLEANTDLTPEMIREILLTTARPLPHAATIRQGYGVVQAAGAVALAVSGDKSTWTKSSPFINYRKKTIEFFFHSLRPISSVALPGEFNGWRTDTHVLVQKEKDLWYIAIPMLPPGIYQYKFVVDQNLWQSDPANFYHCPDGFNGFNNLILIHSYGKL